MEMLTHLDGDRARPPRCSTRHCSSPLFSPAWVVGPPVRWGSRHHDALDVATAAAAISGLAHRDSRGSLALGRAVVTFFYGYHFSQPSTPWATYNGHTFYTHFPAQTLAQRDHVSAEIVTIALVLAVGIGTLDLVVRLVRRMDAVGVAAICGGGMLMLFSLFGLLRGLAGIGTAGLLLILSGLPMKSTAAAEPVLPTHKALHRVGKQTPRSLRAPILGWRLVGHTCRSRSVLG